MRIATVLCLLGLMGVIQAFTETPLTCTGSKTITINELYGVYSYFPNGPSGSYPTSMFCEWIFETADPNLQITFQVMDIYIHCSDQLKLYNGKTTSTQIDFACCVTNCGDYRSKVTTLGNSFTARIMTDGTTNANESGFKIVVISGKEESPCVVPKSHVQLTLTTETTVTSPQFPTPAEGPDICSYTFTYPNGKVKFQIEYLDMEPYLPPHLVCPHKVELFDAAPKIPETTTSSTRKDPRSCICRPKRPLTAIQGKTDKRTQKVIQP
ncbi:uncharacterized protein LOC125662587 isoform X2 [Ostrea edulis]|uniref:uncharacterized protein LOC125662587 isoform X2 n=1 Tax=Ostrea edulis TaxID=37623 RepID=UPI0024AFE009|nr:uncharacterized protein LOC125662587 isoform X2 [Ostrea edulis]